MTSTPERFWVKVNKNGGALPLGQPELGPCWLWEAARYRSGYGHFYAGEGRFVAAHRYAWELEHGPVPLGLNVLHHCDVRACVRDSHLFIGTQADNIQDAMTKGRMVGPPRPIGERNPKAKITKEVAAEVRYLATTGLRQRDIGKQVGLTQSTVSKIVRGSVWASGRTERRPDAART